jgi:hypothetical protein
MEVIRVQPILCIALNIILSNERTVDLLPPHTECRKPRKGKEKRNIRRTGYNQYVSNPIHMSPNFEPFLLLETDPASNLI